MIAALTEERPADRKRETIGQRVRRLRHRAGWSMDDLVGFSRTIDARGVSRGTVAMLEGDKRDYIKPQTRRILAQAFGVSEHYLEHGYDGSPPDGERSEWMDIETFARSKGMTDEQLLAHIRTQFDILLIEDQRRRQLLEDQEM